ncbi:hypothetical protein OESDEN_11276 [Oesophagostomum dentatum]|uniref:Uncharacterized protein n=1 Tax=Oesophagostomum dentatum TaxID=61180 RepID=A0A0B1SUC1_OESDE|nr:hypothetical protein OESDEN_11276 [Oesophagostomum dentatum]
MLRSSSDSKIEEEKGTTLMRWNWRWESICSRTRTNCASLSIPERLDLDAGNHSRRANRDCFVSTTRSSLSAMFSYFEILTSRARTM